MYKALLMAILLDWNSFAHADFFVWDGYKGGGIIGIGVNQADAWKNLGGSSMSGYSGDGLKHHVLLKTCKAPGWYGVLFLYDDQNQRSVFRGVCGSKTKADAQLGAARSCQKDPECNKLLNDAQSWITQSIGFDSGSWLLPEGLYPMKGPGEKISIYECAGYDSGNKDRPARPYCTLQGGDNDLPSQKTRQQMANGQ